MKINIMSFATQTVRTSPPATMPKNKNTEMSPKPVFLLATPEGLCVRPTPHWLCDRVIPFHPKYELAL